MPLITDLIVEILVEIFCRLPATDLLGRVRYTCKLFAAIINQDPTLPGLHLERALMAPPGYLYTYRNNPNAYFVNTMLEKNNPQTRRISKGVKITNGIGPTEIFGHIFSCNGLICYQLIEENGTFFCVRNPFVVGDALKIPAAQVRQLTWGFGYARESKKYKIVRVMQERKPLKHTAAAVYTLGEGFWRVLDIPSGAQLWQPPVHCNGALYWSMPPDHSGYCVVVFDLETENFHFTLRFPPNSRNVFGKTYLTVLANTVTFVIVCTDGCQNVLVLIDRASDTWYELFHLLGPNGCFKLEGSWMSQEVYGTERASWDRQRHQHHTHDGSKRRYVLYNVRRGEYSALRLPFTEDAYACAIADGLSPQLVITHTGSLVSPQKIGPAA